MSFIRTIADDDAEGELAALFDQGRDPQSGQVDNILAVHSLHPAGLGAHLAVYRAVMRGTRGLPKVDRELVAMVVSDINGCHY